MTAAMNLSAEKSKAHVGANVRLQDDAWIGLEEPFQPTGPPKLALLMFVNDKVEHTEIWDAWLEQAERQVNGSVRMLVHASGGTVTKKPVQATVAPQTIPTSWCHIYEAERYLMELALEDASVTHLAVVSGDSVPLKSARAILQLLEENSSSRFCADLDWSPVRAETWFLMRRSNAELFNESQELVRANFVSGCEEEISWFQAVKLRHDSGSGPAWMDECVMFTDWAGSCKGWADHVEGLALGNVRQEPHIEASGVHPRAYLSVDEDAWAELQNSHFWFGRKFAEGAFVNITAPYGFT